MQTILKTRGPEFSERKGGSDNRFLVSMLALFEKTEAGGAAGYAFNDPEYPGDPAGGIAFWEEAKRNSNFPSTRELGAVRDHIPTLISCLPSHINDCLAVEIGAGDEDAVYDKSSFAINVLKKRCKNLEYLSVESNDHYARSSVKIIQNSCSVEASFLNADFAEVAGCGRPNQTVVGFAFGGFAGNVSGDPRRRFNNMLMEHFQRFGQFFKPGDYFVGTHFTDQNDPHEIYNEPANQKTLKAILYKAQRELDTDLDPEKFSVKSTFNRANRMVEMAFKVNEDHPLRINGAYQRDLRSGDRFVPVYSLRAPCEEFRRYAGYADWHFIKHIDDERTGTGIFLAQYQPR